MKRNVLLIKRTSNRRIIDDKTMDKVAKYNLEYQRKNGRRPSFRNIMHALKLGSLATVQRYVKTLEREGRIKRTEIGNLPFSRNY